MNEATPSKLQICDFSQSLAWPRCLEVPLQGKEEETSYYSNLLARDVTLEPQQDGDTERPGLDPGLLLSLGASRASPLWFQLPISQMGELRPREAKQLSLDHTATVNKASTPLEPKLLFASADLSLLL